MIRIRSVTSEQLLSIYPVGQSASGASKPKKKKKKKKKKIEVFPHSLIHNPAFSSRQNAGEKRLFGTKGGPYSRQADGITEIAPITCTDILNIVTRQSREHLKPMTIPDLDVFVVQLPFPKNIS